MTYQVALSTIDDREQAERLARTLLEARLVACVNILGPVTSLFRWQGEIACDTEYLLLMKTTAAKQDILRDRLLQLHPYDVPEFLVLGVDAGAAAYLHWLAAAVTDET
jgi:periplasmic divalent cation tolerance protein